MGIEENRGEKISGRIKKTKYTFKTITMRGEIIYKYEALSAPDFIITRETITDATVERGYVKLGFRLYLGERFHFLAEQVTRRELVEEITPTCVEALLNSAIREWAKYQDFAKKTKEAFVYSLKK